MLPKIPISVWASLGVALIAGFTLGSPLHAVLLGVGYYFLVTVIGLARKQ
ncbi:hypothetical protein [Phenylobacterium sp.]